MDIEFDPAKGAHNEAERGLSFARAADFDWENAVIALDDRRSYGERRWIAVGNLDGALHVLIFTVRRPKIRVISLRRANARERRRHGKA